ncbi:tRNA (adenosine(37)-N6)-threonylcarbamoyltransferase complex ATPase subunit type 1 TsaE [Candidatus Profftia lariciata]|uniref:tRNA (adenosine(37)-N6)-threonylcarbamoyltransferase complex ATPase subunit type 1 TsaE n=1 Tax=Candidatus Profftia lariciata TaxID=1987921 RepID=UPI001D02C76E|nr:tRNA (adenosine(37)-N6)-threonylcarbamoyltransferase complex ATPase subunit type 1 TsaE [Candidatus Profftia lariciata]
MKKIILFLPDDTATISLSHSLANICNNAIIIYLYGDLGSGKTTFSRGFLQKLGYRGHIKSPTYNIVESYNIALMNIYHLDLYRLSNAAELECIGIRDYCNKNAICLIEWPEKGLGFLPEADISLYFYYKQKGREVSIEALTQHGNLLVTQFQKKPW